MGKVTLKVTLKAERNEHGYHNIRLRFTKDRASRYVSLPVFIPESAFNKKGSREKLNWVRQTHPNSAVLNNTIRTAIDRALLVIESIGANPESTVDSIRKRYDTYGNEIVEQSDGLPGLIAYGRLYIRRMFPNSTSSNYESALKAFEKFLTFTSRSPAEIAFKDINRNLLKEYQAWAGTQHKKNTSWLYYSRLKTFYYAAQEEFDEVDKLGDPFRRVIFKKEKVAKERLVEGEIARLAALDLSLGKTIRHVRDICLCMYYAQGMRIGDALALKKRNYVIEEEYNKEREWVTHHRLRYVMEKSKRPRSVKLPADLVEILEPYLLTASDPDEPIFPFMRKHYAKAYTVEALKLKKKSIESYIDGRVLPKLMKLAAIDKHVTAHVFRHSFADMLRRMGKDTARISMSLGHESLKTTEQYLSDFDQQSVDDVQDVFEK